jgi:hypothetical protein
MTRRYVAWLWLLSGAPIGLALIFLPPAVRLWIFALFVLLDTGHSLSPIILAWTHREFRRQVIYPQPAKFLLLPGLIAGVAVLIGIATQAGWTSFQPGLGAYIRITGWRNPLPLLVWVYSAWNLYHFGMQNYGVASLLLQVNRARSSSSHGSYSGSVVGFLRLRNRCALKWFCLIGFLVIYFVVSGINVLGFWWIPGLDQDIWWLGPLVLSGMLSANHWIVDIGLSARVRGWWFPIVVLAAGMIGFVWLVPTPNERLIRTIPAIVCVPMALGFMHFLYSRWVWQFSDPRVRATIGRDLVARPA